MADKTAAPSGAGYAMANRRITSRVLAEVHRDASLARLRGWFHTMAAALASAAPVDVDVPRVVLLSPGSGSETAYDQGFLATLLGFPLVEADDLSVRDGRVWIRSTARREEVDVVLRRVDADVLRPARAAGRLPARHRRARRGDPPGCRPAGQPAGRGRAGERRAGGLPPRGGPPAARRGPAAAVGHHVVVRRRRGPLARAGQPRPARRQAGRPRAGAVGTVRLGAGRRRPRRPAPRGRGPAVGLGRARSRCRCPPRRS